jgi:hypothetical protein
LVGNKGIARPADTGRRTSIVSQGKLLMIKIKKL